MFKHVTLSFWIPAALLSLALLLMHVIWPTAADEIYYMLDLRHYTGLNGGSVAAGIVDAMVSHAGHDNIRLCNIAYMCTAPLAEWADWPLLWVAYLIWLVATARVAGISPCRWPAALLVFSGAVFFPTSEMLMFDECYQYNYPAAVALTLVMAWLFLHDGSVPWWLMAFCGLVAGWWHEGFGIPLASGAVGLILFMPRRFRDRRHIAFALAAIVGASIIALTPGTAVRFSSVKSASMTLAEVFQAHMPAVLSLAAVAVAALAPALRRALSWPLVLFFVINIAASLTINVVIGFFPRVGYWADPASLVIWLHLAMIAYHKMLGEIRRRRALILLTRLAIVAVGTCASIWVALCIWGGVYFRHSIEALYRSAARVPVLVGSAANPKITVFGPVVDVFERPGLNAAWPFYRELLSSVWTTGIICEYQHGANAFYHFIPFELEYMTSRGGVAAGSDPAVRRIGAHFYFAADDFPQVADAQGLEAECRLGPVTRRFPIELCPFRSKADGRTYYYMRFKTGGRIPMLWPVDSLEITDWYEARE